MNDHILPSKLTLGFSAFISLALVTALTKDNIDSSLMVFVYSSAIAIPALFTYLLILLEYVANNNIKPSTPLSYLMTASGVIGYLTGFIAIAAVFWHFSVWASLFFIGSILAWSYFLGRYLLKKYKGVASFFDNTR